MYILICDAKTLVALKYAFKIEVVHLQQEMRQLEELLVSRICQLLCAPTSWLFV